MGCEGSKDTVKKSQHVATPEMKALWDEEMECMKKMPEAA